MSDSFAKLRASRQAKESKSYVKSTHGAQPPSPSVLSQPLSTQGSNSAQIVDYDGLYNSIPPNLDIRSSNTSGRGLWTKAHLKPGDILISVKPSIAALSNSSLDSYCSNCFGPPLSSGLKRCTSCRTIWYCNPTCQNRDWALHKKECSALQHWAESAPSPDLLIPSDAIRCLGRMMWQKQKQGSSSVWAREMDNMQSHRASLEPSSFELHTHLSHALVRYLGISSPEELAVFGLTSVGDVVDIISRFITNTFAITTPTLTPIGASVSPTVALINHSCDPNAVIVFPRTPSSQSNQEPIMQVIALRSIAPDEEVLTAYIDTTFPRALRQNLLKETYSFSCSCRLCSDPPEIDPRESMWCPKSCSGTCPIPTESNNLSRCAKCKALVKSTDAVLDAVRVGQEAVDKATDIQFKDPDKAKQLATNLIPILVSAGLTPSSHPLLALSHLQQSLLISSFPSPVTQDYLDEVIRIATRTTTGLSSVLHYGHPVRGIAFAELGKALAVDEPEPRQAASPAEVALRYPPSGPPRLKLAHQTLVRARNELLIGFGCCNEGGEVGKEVRETIVALEKELGIWNQGVQNALEDISRKPVKGGRIYKKPV